MRRFSARRSTRASTTFGPGCRGPHDEPTPLDERIDRLRRFRGMFDLGQDFIYGLFTRDETEVVGGSGLHTRVGEGALEIGYWLRTSRVGAGLAREATAALTYVAFRVCEVDRVEIRIDPANERKPGGPARARLRRGGDAPTPASPPEPTACRATWSSSRSFATTSRAWRLSRTELEAFDALGRRLLV